MCDYPLQLPSSLKRAAQRLAEANGITLNQFCVVAIAEKVNAIEGAEFFAKRAAASDPAAAQAVWDKVPARPADPEDVWGSLLPDSQ